MPSILDNETFDILKKLQNKAPAEFITCLHKFYLKTMKNERNIHIAYSEAGLFET